MSKLSIKKSNVVMLKDSSVDRYKLNVKYAINANALALTALIERVEELEKEIEVLKNERK